MHDVSLMVVYNTPINATHLKGEICHIDTPASKFATWVGGEYVSNTVIKSPRAVKIHVINIDDSFDLRKLLDPHFSPDGESTLLRRGVKVILNRLSPELILDVSRQHRKEATVNWLDFKTCIYNYAYDRELLESDVVRV